MSAFSEAGMIGCAAGVIGTVLGFLVAGVVASINHWPLAPAPWLVVAGIAIAILAALLGAAMPARVATRITPAEALRRD